MTNFIIVLRRTGTAVLGIFDALCDRYERSQAWSDKLFLR